MNFMCFLDINTSTCKTSYITYKFAEAFLQDVTYPLVDGNEFKSVSKLVSQTAVAVICYANPSQPLFAVFCFYIGTRHKICRAAHCFESYRLLYGWPHHFHTTWFITHRQCVTSADKLTSLIVISRNIAYIVIQHNIQLKKKKITQITPLPILMHVL